MEQLVKIVIERTGISEDQAQKAVEAVVGELKKRLPEPIAGQIDRVLGGEGTEADDPLGDLSGMLGR